MPSRVLALLITCVGLYGTVSYGMVRRTQEIGIRVALGASRARVLRLAFGQVLFLGVAGLAIGVPAALTASRFVESFLWGVEPGDPATMAAAAGTLLLAVCLAGYIPASRASRVGILWRRCAPSRSAFGSASAPPGLRRMTLDPFSASDVDQSVRRAASGSARLARRAGR